MPTSLLVEESFGSFKFEAYPILSGVHLGGIASLTMSFSYLPFTYGIQD